MHKALIGVVVGISEEGTPSGWQACRVHCKAMVLGGNEAALGALMEAGLIVSTVPIPEKADRFGSWRTCPSTILGQKPPSPTERIFSLLSLKTSKAAYEKCTTKRTQ